MYPTYRSHGEPAEVKPMLSLCKTLIDVLKFSIHFWGTSSISVPLLWRDSLLFKGFQYYFHSIYPTYRSHGEPAEVNMMLSLCKTLIDVLKFSVHFWGTSSFSVPQLWRDSLLFKGFQYYFHSIYPTYRSHGEPAEVKHDAFIVQDWNQCTEIQYPLLGHFFNLSTTAVKR